MTILIPYITIFHLQSFQMITIKEGIQPVKDIKPVKWKVAVKTVAYETVTT